YDAGEVLQADARVWFGRDDRVDLVAQDTVYLTVPRGTRESLKATLVVDSLIRAPLDTTTVVGLLKVDNGGEPLISVPVVPDRGGAEPGSWARPWDRVVLCFKGLSS